MRRELQHIPPAPRTPRWPPVLWARWPLAFLAFIGAVYGGVITLMFVYAWGAQPSDDTLLDRVGRRAAARVTEVELRDAVLQGHRVARVRYQFECTPPREAAPAQSMDGEVFAIAGKYSIDATIEVDFVPDRPHISRIVGERLSRLSDLSLPMWRWFVLPGWCALALWFIGVLRTRSLLRHGDVGVAELLEVRRLRFVLPGMLRVTYRFRDHRARDRSGQHWVRARSCLGRKLTVSPPPTATPLVHHRSRPWRSRVVTVDDFVLVPVTPRKHAADAPAPWTHDP